MAKRKRKSKASPTPKSDASAQPTETSAAKPARKSARKAPAKPTGKSARKAARKPRGNKRISPADRRALLAEAKSKGWTAEQIAKKAGVSKWTVYGWNKRRAKGRATGSPRRGRKPGRPSSRVPIGLSAHFREMITAIVREEIGRLLGGVR